ncbi:methyltransferase [Microbulbifer halophilus]
MHTPMSVLLRSDHSRSLRPFARMIGMPAIWRGVTDLEHAARTGMPALNQAQMISYLADHPAESSLFNQAMTSKSADAVAAVVETYDFGAFDRIADIGGGRGHLLQAILERTAATGILFDLPQVIDDAAGIDPRQIQLVGGDFFRDPLPVADAYILMDILHGWADDRAADILSGIHRSIPPHGRVFVIETLVSGSPGPHFGKTLDIMMLAVTGGRERTGAEYGKLLESTGFYLERVTPTESQYSIVEAAVA